MGTTVITMATGGCHQSRALLLLLMAGSCILYVCGVSRDEGVATMDAHSPDNSEPSKCFQSVAARQEVCRLYGETSSACKEVAAAVSSKSSAWCGDDSIGESFGSDVAAAYKSRVSRVQDCKDFNKDQVPQSICKEAKTLCNVENKDYCTKQLLYDCLATIGRVCPDTPDMTHGPYKL